MVDSQDLNALWQIRLGSNADSRTTFATPCTVDVTAPPTIHRMVQHSADGIFVVTSGLDESHDKRLCLAELVIGNGAVCLLTRVHKTFVKPESCFNESLCPKFELKKPSKNAASSVYLRPGDEVVFEDHQVYAVLERASVPETQPGVIVQPAEVEVRSSGAEAAAAAGDSDTEDDGDLDATIIPAESQVTAAPFSTARSTLQAVEETPRTSRVADPTVATEPVKASSPSPSEQALPSTAKVLKASQSASNRGRKRPSQAIEQNDPSSSVGPTSQSSKRKKINADSSSSRDTPKRSAAEKQTLDGASSFTVSSSASNPKPRRVAFSGIGPFSKDVLTFLKRQKVSILDDIEAQAKQTDPETICCVGKGELKTTAKVLKALVHNFPVITDAWIDQSLEAREILDPMRFIVDSLPKDVDRSNLFEKRQIYFTKAAGKSYARAFGDMVKILVVAGAEKPSIRTAKALDNVKSTDIIIGLDGNDEDVVQLLQRGERCYMKELINASILQGELLVEDPSLQLSLSEEPVTKEPAKRGRKKT